MFIEISYLKEGIWVKKKKLIKIIIAAAVVIAVVAVAVVIAESVWLHNNSVGIISGADGPTAVFVSKIK